MKWRRRFESAKVTLTLTPTLTLTLTLALALTLICEGVLIPTDSEDYSARMHQALMENLNPGTPIVPLSFPKKNTEPIRDFLRIALARAVSVGKPRVLGEEGDRKEWDQAMYDRAMETLPAAEAQCTAVLQRMVNQQKR